MVKQENIVDAAIRRFSHFGIGKTTLTEIAEDLSLSKQALAYHFADKQSLVLAVGEKVAHEFLQSLEMDMKAAGSVWESLMILVDSGHRFMQKYYHLAMQIENLDAASRSTMNGIKNTIYQQQLVLLSRLFGEGIRKGELRQLDTSHTAGLLLDTLHAFSLCIKSKGPLPSMEVFETIREKETAVLQLFYEGIKNRQV